MPRSYATGGGGGGTPGGSNTDVQFNDSGAFGGQDSLTFDKVHSRLYVNQGPAPFGANAVLEVGGTEGLLISRKDNSRNEDAPPLQLLAYLDNGNFGGSQIKSYYPASNPGVGQHGLAFYNTGVVGNSSFTKFMTLDNQGQLTLFQDPSVVSQPISFIATSEKVDLVYDDSSSKGNSGEFLKATGSGIHWTAASLPTFSDNETPTGSIDSSNVTFMLANSPSPAASLQLIYNGQFQLFGTDYTLSGGTITFTTAPATGTWIRAYYRY